MNDFNQTQIVKYPIKTTLRKKGAMVFFSQIDLIHILERTLRRTDLELYFTQGFRPHVKISLLTGLKLGLEGVIEAVFYFSRDISFDRFEESLSKELPQGLEIISVSKY